MGGRSSSSSAQTTNQTDNRRVIGEAGISAENSAVSQNISTTTISADPAVTGAALGFGRDVADLSITANSDTTNRALNTVDKTTMGAFNFGTDALAGAFDFGKYSVNAVTSTAADAMAYSDAAAKRASATTGRALDLADETYGTALSFGKGIVSQAFDSASQSASFVKDAYADAKGRGALTDKILIGAVIAMAVVAVAATHKG